MSRKVGGPAPTSPLEPLLHPRHQGVLPDSAQPIGRHDGLRRVRVLGIHPNATPALVARRCDRALSSVPAPSPQVPSAPATTEETWREAGMLQASQRIAEQQARASPESRSNSMGDSPLSRRRWLYPSARCGFDSELPQHRPTPSHRGVNLMGEHEERVTSDGRERLWIRLHGHSHLAAGTT